MKKTSLLVTLPTLVLAGLLLSGCGMFRSTKAWDTAKQETPLEIPPGMDTPPANDALVIPPPGAEQAAATPAAQVADGFVVAGTVDDTYKKIGQAIEEGGIGQLAAHDDQAHSYTVNVVGGEAPAAKKGFFGRLFGGGDKQKSTSLGGASHPVVITVAPSGTSGSEVHAQGNAGAVAKAIDALKGRLGG